MCITGLIWFSGREKVRLTVPKSSSSDQEIPHHKVNIQQRSKKRSKKHTETNEIDEIFGI